MFIYLVSLGQVVIINYKVLGSNWLGNLIINLIKLTPYRVIWEILNNFIYKS